jgi:hypothetical protein
VKPKQTLKASWTPMAFELPGAGEKKKGWLPSGSQPFKESSG